MAEVEVTLHRSTFSFRRRWKAKPPTKRRQNDLSPAVGLLELSNALDFAANIWNAIPPPTISMVFMAIGATGALTILAFAVFDLPQAWRNIVLLREERHQLLSLRRYSHSGSEVATPNGLSERDIQTHLDMNRRELGNEVIDRLTMGLLLGFGALTVGIGTYLAIDGANPTSYLASNVITGYLGNVPAALYGLMNAMWCVYGWRRAQRHASAAVANLRSESCGGRGIEIAKKIEGHSRRVKLHAVVNGISGILGGAGSLMTASAYIVPVGVWGYVILLPCAISTFATNLYFRRKINYSRNIVEPFSVVHDKVLNDAVYALKLERLLSGYHHDFRSHKTSSQRKNLDVDQSMLQSLLTDYYAITLEWLVDEAQRLTKPLEIPYDKAAEKGDQPVSDYRADLDRELETVQAQIGQVNASLFRLSLTVSTPEKQSIPSDLLDVVWDFLLSTDLFSSLCVSIANDSGMTSLFSTDLASAQEHIINSSMLRQLLADNARLTVPLLKLVCAVLAKDGVKHARSRVRRLCEFCGCAFSQSAR